MPSAPSTHRLTAAERATRLAEMVVGLTGCEPTGAIDAVRTEAHHDDPLAVVAAAMVTVDRERRAALDLAGEPTAADVIELDLRRAQTGLRIDLTGDGRHQRG